MTTNQRLEPLLEQYDWATERLLTRLAGPTSNSGDGSDVDVPVLMDAEYLWERSTRAGRFGGAPMGPDRAPSSSSAQESGDETAPLKVRGPPPLTTIAWRLDHICETLLGRSSHLGGDRTFSSDERITTRCSRRH